MEDESKCFIKFDVVGDEGSDEEMREERERERERGWCMCACDSVIFQVSFTHYSIQIEFLKCLLAAHSATWPSAGEKSTKTVASTTTSALRAPEVCLALSLSHSLIFNIVLHRHLFTLWFNPPPFILSLWFLHSLSRVPKFEYKVVTIPSVASLSQRDST